MCAHGMKVKNREGELLPVFKATGWMTNSKCLLHELALDCPGCPVHIRLLNSRATEASIWPERLCYEILRGLRKQLNRDKVMHEGEIGSVSEDPIEKQFQKSLEHPSHFSATPTTTEHIDENHSNGL